jgi:hypothetical protein
VTAHAWNPSTWGAKEEDHDFEVSLGWLVGPCLKKPRKNFINLIKSTNKKISSTYQTHSEI